jgi:NAD(P)-dependent dehydrogenase (short-subunit alcohol dehydrogenase family)
MYLAPLDLKKVMADKIKKYDKMATYANVKRAQVDLLEFFAQEFSDYSVVAMHPGWVDTPALSGAMKDFYKSLGQNLRTPQEGADTIYWLMGSKKLPQSGKLYFDRARVRKHYFPHTFLFNDKAESLYKLLQTYKPNL